MPTVNKKFIVIIISFSAGKPLPKPPPVKGIQYLGKYRNFSEFSRISSSEIILISAFAANGLSKLNSLPIY